MTTPTLPATEVLVELAAERARQDDKWGQQDHPDGTGPLALEWALRAKEMCQQAHQDGDQTWALVLEEEVAEACAEDDPHRLRAELVQVAAVAVAWIEALDRRLAAAG